MKSKVFAGIEMILMIVSLFSFAYFVGFGKDVFAIVSAEEEEEESRLQEFLDKMSGGVLTESESWENYPISSSADGAGCCFVNVEGQVCGTASPENCIDDSPFAEGALCAATSFCEKGCCYDESSGVYDKNVLEFACSAEWIGDPNCNMPGAKLGCCVLGSETIFETRGQCEVNSLARAIGGESVVDWRDEVDEGGCLFLAAVQKEGACILGGGECKFLTEGDCFSESGNFNEGYLCSSPSLNTSCEMTRQTSCVDGKDGVYFLDSCGNVANIYDAERVEDVDYWDRVMEPEEICGSGDIEGGNANSVDCGNCDRFAGGICASAGEDNFEVDIGSFYCRDTSCMFDGVSYENGESWCVYDGTIGDGDDVVGSRHWKYVCSQGIIQVEPCADYRNQICVQTKEFEVNGTMVEFENAACIANNWRECIDLNSEEDGEGSNASSETCVRSRSATMDCGNRTLYRSDAARMECVEDAAEYCGASDGEDVMDKCAETLNCRVETIDIADKFKFDVCLPKYPAGFDLNDERYMLSAERLCGMADQTCTVIRKAKKWGGCEYVANENCLSGTFAEEMNEFCTGLGDCGGSANILGEYSENYVVKRDGSLNRGMFLSQEWINALKTLAVPVPGQYAEVEDYSEYLTAAGIWGGAEAVNAGEGEEEEGIDVSMVGRGLSGIGMAVNFAFTGKVLGVAVLKGGGLIGGELAAGYSAAGHVAETELFMSYNSVHAQGASMAGFAGYAMGAGMGMVVGLMIAKQLGLSEGGTMLMALGGAMVGAQLMGTYMMTGMMAMGPIGWIGLAIMVIASFFAGSACPPIEVAFECKPWVPLSGSDSCSDCNDDPLKPCSKYRCESLGAGCDLINVGTEDELCVDGNPNDVEVPIIRRDIEVGFDDGSYKDEESGSSVVGVDGGCLDAYTPLTLGISTNEPAQCRFDMEAKDFEDMSFELGGNSYLYEHNEVFSLPDPSHGQSQGLNWSGDLNLYIKCKDTHGLISHGFYEVDMCVVEGDDKTAPSIVAEEGSGIVGFDVTSGDVSIITNELATCRWDLEDVDYLEMENDFVCYDSLGKPSNVFGYECSGTLPIANSTDYYVRCMDQPWENESSDRNANAESFVLSLTKPSSKISIDKVAPDEDIEISTDSVTIDLKVATSGGGEFHFCSYSFSGYDRMIRMFETGNERTHVQTLNFAPGKKEVYIECRDETGDFDRSSSEFEIVRDSSSPLVARVWVENGFVNLFLLEAGECSYSLDSCLFAWSEGVSIGSGTDLRFSAIYGERYFVRCEDEFGNSPSGCSVEVVAV